MAGSLAEVAREACSSGSQVLLSRPAGKPTRSVMTVWGARRWLIQRRSWSSTGLLKKGPDRGRCDLCCGKRADAGRSGVESVPWMDQ